MTYEERITIVNPDDYNDHFWKNNYLIRVTYQGIPFLVNADHEQAAIDLLIDYCEENVPGLVSSYGELRNEGYTDEEIEDIISGGNHCLYLMVDDAISIERVTL